MYYINSYRKFDRIIIKCNIIQYVEKENPKVLLDKFKFKKTWLSKLGCHGNVDIGVHVTTTLKFSQNNGTKL